MLKNHHTIELDYPLKSLCWYGDDRVIDIIGGHKIYNVSGDIEDLSKKSSRIRISYRFNFDRTKISKCGRYAVMYVAFGTKGVLLKDLKIVREINRSYYCSDAYEFPIALLERPNEEPLVVYCPDSYDQLEVEEFTSGKRIGAELEREPTDYFFGNLILSPDFQYLLSLGWVWHPAEIAKLFKMDQILTDIRITDTHDDILQVNLKDIKWDEDLTGCFTTENQLILFRKDYDEDEGRLIGYDFVENKVLFQTTSSHPIGTLLPLSQNWVLNMCGRLSVLDAETGKVLFEYDKVKVSERKSVLYEKEDDPIWAFNEQTRKLAITYDKELHILEFE